MHNYIGIDFDSLERGVVKLSMIKNIEKIFNDFPEDIGKASSTPASEHLFQVLDPEEMERKGKVPARKNGATFSSLH